MLCVSKHADPVTLASPDYSALASIGNLMPLLSFVEMQLLMLEGTCSPFCS